MAAPAATTSSGLTLLLGSRRKNSATRVCTSGMRVCPPTSSTSSMSETSSSASSSTCRHGSRVRSISRLVSSSSFRRLSVAVKCSGCPLLAAMNGRLISVSNDQLSSCLAFSAASLSRCVASFSDRRSMPFSARNCSAHQLTMVLSKSSPPKKVSPAVASTSNTPSRSSRMEMSNVPPPRSYTATVRVSPRLCRPYDNVAAVGSLMMRSTVSPARRPASLVACRWASLK